jgi:hypothetical protein
MDLKMLKQGSFELWSPSKLLSDITSKLS